MKKEADNKEQTNYITAYVDSNGVKYIAPFFCEVKKEQTEDD